MMKKKSAIETRYKVLIDRLNLTEIQKDILTITWLNYLSLMSAKAKRGIISYNFCQLLIVFLSLVIPVLEGMQLTPIPIGGTQSKGLTYVTVLSLIIAICTALNRQLGFDSKWRHYRRSTEMMRNEGDDFLALAGDYKDFRNHDEAISSFISAVTTFKRQEVGSYLDGKNKPNDDQNAVSR
jgi:hypothetical protein